MVTTEIASLSISAGNEQIGDPANPGAKILAQTAQSLLNTKGTKRVFIGNTVEDQQSVKLLVDWDSYSDQKAFVSSERYGPFLSSIKPILTGKPFILHVDLNPAAEYEAAVSAPVTEIVVFFFDGPVPADYAAGIEKSRVSWPGHKGYRGSACGFSHETDIEYEGVKGQAAVHIFGWDSVEDHMEVRKQPIFHEVVPYLRSSSKKSKMEHIKLLPALKD